MKIFLRLLQDFKEFVGASKYYSLFAFGLLTSFITVIEPLFFARILSIVEEFIKTGVFDGTTLYSQVLIWCIFILVSIIVQYVYRYYIVDRMTLQFYVHVVKKYSQRALTISYGSYLGKKQGETFKRLDRGKGFMMNFLFFFFIEIIKTFSGIWLIVILMLFINVKMTLITLSALPIAILIGFYFNSKTVQLQRDNTAREDEMLGVIGDSLTNFALTKILSLEKKIAWNFSSSLGVLLSNQYTISKRWSIASIYIAVIVMVVRLVVLVSGVYFMKAGEINLAELFLFFAYIGWIYFPLGGIFNQLKTVQEQAVGIEKFYQEFEDEIELEDLQDNGKTIKNPQGDISFRDVTFGYLDNKKVLDNINLDINSGQKIALVGNTGAGKSTIVNLIFRLWDISSGSINLDGVDIRDISKQSLRNNIGLVAQDNSLFNMSIKDNLKFAQPKATLVDIKKALKQAQAEFVFDLEHGIDTIIGERGLKLSGGEKQRLSIARLFLKDPKILILDEATSALDNKTEKKIQKALDTLMKGRTSIIIAHRLSTIQDVDTIYMLENGKIVESGNYEELMNKKAKFYDLANPDHLILN